MSSAVNHTSLSAGRSAGHTNIGRIARAPTARKGQPGGANSQITPTAASATKTRGGVATGTLAQSNDAPQPSSVATIAKIASAAPSTGSASKDTGVGSVASAPPINASGVTAQLTVGIATAFASGDTIDS